MRQYTYLFLLILLSLSTPSFAQFNDELDDQIPNNDIDLGGYREGLLGVGFPDAAGLLGAIGGTTLNQLNPTARFTVSGGILAHHISGTVGSFSGKWLGLGVGNPGAPLSSPKPYGLAIADDNNVGFYNLLKETFNGADRYNTVAGFGFSGGDNTNRFIVRGYSGNFASFGKDIIVANPRGAVGINSEPFAAFSVETRRSANGVLPGIPPIVNAIAIQGEQPFFPDNSGLVTSSSGVGVQANTSLALSGVAVEGSRSQIPSFVPNNPPQLPSSGTLGVAVNIQAVFDPSGGPNSFSPTLATTQQQDREYAEITWQDLDFANDVTTDCPLPGAVPDNKFYISFRNGRNGLAGGVVDPIKGNSFSTFNKLPVLTLTPRGRVGIGNTNPVCNANGKPIFLDVNGWINSAGGFLIGSDARYKKEIKTIENAMDLVRKMRGTTYMLRTDEFEEKHFDTGKQYGFIAQEMEQVIPEIATPNNDGYYSVNYTALIPVLTEAIKEQDKTVTELRNELAELRSQLNDLKAGQQPSDLKGYRLDQNTPNPTNGNTVIAYALPAGTTGARITVYDLAGRTIKSWSLSEAEGQITLDAGSLSGGLYIYDLQVGGRQILERKMSVVGKN